MCSSLEDLTDPIETPPLVVTAAPGIAATTEMSDDGPTNARNPDNDMMMIQAELQNASHWSEYVPTPRADTQGTDAAQVATPTTPKSCTLGRSCYDTIIYKGLPHDAHWMYLLREILDMIAAEDYGWTNNDLQANAAMERPAQSDERAAVTEEKASLAKVRAAFANERAIFAEERPAVAEERPRFFEGKSRPAHVQYAKLEQIVVASIVAAFAVAMAGEGAEFTEQKVAVTRPEAEFAEEPNTSGRKGDKISRKGYRGGES
ncbi:hypothetical protein FN846DRAFT_996967 [Sphaerosporella brunnea]|uniref:Uncharacterized protein n=1 Tax=Sphaerosporella brunnea TaxID=1250544 RepID=A0A5J5F629_9PEZI|nr:hypothetical protein FN846DRAFT_996967 [Sphaerosporella brunnea]